MAKLKLDIKMTDIPDGIIFYEVHDCAPILTDDQLKELANGDLASIPLNQILSDDYETVSLIDGEILIHHIEFEQLKHLANRQV